MRTQQFIKRFIVFIPFLYFNLIFSAPQDSLTINVVSYNIQTGGYYQPETPQLLAQFVKDWNVDIFGTQELHTIQAKAIDKALPEFSRFGVGRDDGKEFGETSTIFYKVEKFELLEQSTFWLSETPDEVGSKSWSSSDVRIVTWGKFLVKAIQKEIYVFNTHYDHISSYARIESSKLLRLKMHEIAGLNPIIITGDLNCSFGSSPYNILIEDNPNDLSIYDTEKICISDPFGPTGSYNNFDNVNPTLKIDFIFVNDFIKSLRCGIINEIPNGKYISDHFPVFTELSFNFPTAPIVPTVIAVAGDNQVNLSWNKISEDSTYESFLINNNDFQGYKLYRSRDPEMKDAVLVEGSWDTPLLRAPLLVSDKIDGIYGYTNYGIINGFGYYLGEDYGLQHYYTDYDVSNGVKYYYVLTTYDNGISGISTGFAPNECGYEIIIDNDENIIHKSKNTAIAIPNKPNGGIVIPTVSSDDNNLSIGNSRIIPQIFNPQKITKKGTYKIKFLVDTLEYHELNERYRHPRDLLYLNKGFKVFRMDNDSLVYFEDKNSYTANNIVYDKIDNLYYLNDNQPIVTEEFEGIQLRMEYENRIPQYSEVKSGWINGDAEIKILPSISESKYFPWQYEIVFTDNNEAYTGLTNKVKGIRSHDDLPLGPATLLLNEKFNFYVENKSFQNDDGTYEKLDLIVYDKNMNGTFEQENDQILAGHCITLANQILWSGTILAIDFSSITDELSMPQPNNNYLVDFDRPYMESDDILLNVDPAGGVTKIEEIENIPSKFKLGQNYPNPFNPTTTINFSLAQSGNYSLKVYNILGEIVSTIFDNYYPEGWYTKRFNADKLASGVYIYRLEGQGVNISKKMLVIK